MGKVLFVTNDFPTRRGGIERFVFELASRMPPDDVVVYTASMPGDAEYDAELAFPVYRDPASMLLPTPAVGRRVARVMREDGCDRVVFGASAPLGLLAPSLRRAGARRLVALTHGHEVWWARVPVTRQLLRRIGDSVDVMTYVSEWCRERIAPALSLPAAERMERLSPGVDTDRFYPGCGGEEVRRMLGIPADAPVVVSVGRMVARKGQDVLVRAWPTVLARVPDARLLLAGDGTHRRQVEALVDRLRLRDSVCFLGSVAPDDIPAILNSGDVFAAPSRSRLFGLEAEAFGIVYLEAAACGVPIVAGNQGGVPEVVLDNVNGLLVDARRSSDVSGAMVKILADEHVRKQLSPYGRELPLIRQWDDVIGRLMRLLSRPLPSSRAEPVRGATKHRDAADQPAGGSPRLGSV